MGLGHGPVLPHTVAIMFADETTELPTPCLVVDEAAFERNVAALARVLPGTRVRPHVKAFKSTALAARLAANGHTGFTCATPAEVDGMLDAGLGDDLLLANETVDVERLRRIADGRGRVTVAVDSSATIAAAVEAGIAEVVIDVNVGLPRCGCAPETAGSLADEARAAGLEHEGRPLQHGRVPPARPATRVQCPGLLQADRPARPVPGPLARGPRPLPRTRSPLGRARALIP